MLKNGNQRIKTFSQTQRPPSKIMSYVSKISSLKWWWFFFFFFNRNSGTTKPCKTLQASTELCQLTSAADLAIHAQTTSCSRPRNHRITIQTCMDMRNHCMSPLSSVWYDSFKHPSKFEQAAIQHVDTC